jgi:hypothetical protein
MILIIFGYIYFFNLKGSDLMKKFYIFRLKSDISYIYAWTDNKKDRDKFLFQRNRNIFISEKIKVDDVDGKEFSDLFNDSRLYEEVLYDGKEDMYILATAYESLMLDREYDRICDTFCSLIQNYSKFNNIDNRCIYNTIEKIIVNIKDYSSIDNLIYKVSTGEIPVNTFKLFYKLFSDTF